ncbi:PVC-type heme-binding CxxCH protein [Roseimicrobium sp. ORNL1]|uniref:PVC-type heme-binding CxxCH protein n=1 Tax=Roseimicrobium sp. ORNL1 TaxID=2711231 RepID=UPI0013E0F712|nr:PVC-type heme-binding CxxCH protein [Roseimicrobium sp. ORNL1]QIF05456.1 dehydrogenase [Roseimicrobium sp. ORNL1]
MKRFIIPALTLALGAAGFLQSQLQAADAKKSIVMIAGKPSHGPGQHEHNAGVQLLAKCLKESGLPVEPTVLLNGQWPTPEVLAKADAILIYSDGGGGHPALQENRLEQLDKEMKRGAGFVCLHYAVEPTLQKGNNEFIDWLGGAFEVNWSVNPHWDANFKELPKHPISSGVKPFSTNDEWYFHMRFRRNMEGVTPILSDVPPDSTMSRKDGDHSGNPDVRAEVAAKKPQHVAWAVEREGGGRGFGFTGGHFHKGWGNDDQRKLVLNAIAWAAKADVPAEGVASKVTEDDLKANLDPKPGQGLPEKPKAPAATPAPAAPAKQAAAPEGGAKPLFKKEISKATGVSEIKVDLAGAKELYLVVHEGEDGIACDWVDWIEPTLVMEDGTRTKLSDVKMKQATSGWGGVVINRNTGGGDMAVEGYTPKSKSGRLLGIGTHSNSVIAFDLPAGVKSLETSIGLDAGGTKQTQNNKAVAMVFTSAPAPALVQAGSSGGGKPHGFAEAKEQMDGFTTPKGLKATLFAAEPMVQNPTNLDIDPKGRVWIAESVNYRSSMKAWGILRPEGDRVVIVEDTNGDGEADKETTFYQSKDVTNALGVCVLPNPSGKGTHVLLSASPNLWLLTDADGDDKAEKADIILKVGGNFDHDHNLHAVVFGPDGKFYFNFGNEGRKLLYPDGSAVVDLMGREVADAGKPYRQGMIFRCDIDLNAAKVSHVETLAHNFRNNYEVCVDSFGAAWQSDNDDDGNKGVRINAILDYGNYGYTDELTGAGWRTERTNMETEIPLRHWYQNDPGSIPNLLQTGSGSPTGILINEGSALGKQFAGELIHCDAGPRTVRAYPVKKTGAGYTAEMVDILTTNDTWYRPSDVNIAPDGSLFVADWYDPGVGGHNMGDNIAGEIRGRIYRVAPEGLAWKAATPDFNSVAGCIEALKSPNGSTRYVAWNKLYEMLQGPAFTKTVTKDKDGNESVSMKIDSAKGAVSDAEKALQLLYTNGTSRQRARALHLLIRIPGKARQYLDPALKDGDADIRATAVRELRLASILVNADAPKSNVTGTFPHIFKSGENAADVLGALVAGESNKQVLREYAITLRVVEPPQPSTSTHIEKENPANGKPGKVEIVDAAPVDKALAVWVALAKKHDGNDRWYVEALGIGAIGREDACLKAWLDSVGKDGWNGPAGRDIIWRTRSSVSSQFLAALLTNAKSEEATLPRYLRAFDFIPASEEKNVALLKVATGNEKRIALAGEALKRLRNTPYKDKPEVQAALDSVLTSAKGTPTYIEMVEDFGITGKNAELLEAALKDIKDPRAQDAVKLLLKQPEGRKLLGDTLAGKDAESLIALLGASGDKGAVKLLSDILTDTKREAPVRSGAVKALSLSVPGATALVEMSEGGKFPEDMKANAGTALSMVQYPGISERVSKAFPTPQVAGGQALPSIAELVKLKGNAAKGKEVFARAQSSCTLCHRAGDVGVDFGPGLGEIGSKLGKEVLFEAILNPNAGVSMGFETWSITLKNGQSAMGIIRSETNDQLVLALPGGVANTFEKRLIDKRDKLPMSMMPTGLQALFSQDDLVNLVEYLSSLKAKTVKK